MAMDTEIEWNYLGLDLSTQQLKAVVINSKKEVLHEAHVQYDNDLPEFRTHKGVVKGQKKNVTSPVLMWVKALDMLLEKLTLCGVDFSKISAISGSAQQHGCVYWAVGAEDTLKSVKEFSFLHSQLLSCFSIPNSPVWMDASTTLQCIQLEEALGGATELAKITGSRAYERYSASQIAKIVQEKSTSYKNTEVARFVNISKFKNLIQNFFYQRISLISSFVCSLFLSKYASIDYSDGSGMNLLDITTKKWSPQCLQAVSPDLEDKLGQPVPSDTILGKISNYYVERFSFNRQCDIIAFTGDNPSSLAGMCLREGDIAISLGTSDTLFIWLNKPKILKNGHCLINPVISEDYMGLLCFKNGSISRDRIRDSTANGNWDEFNSLLNSTPRGNFGYMGHYYNFHEIDVPLEGDFRFDKADNQIDKFPSPEIEIRALIEGQFISMRSHLDELETNLSEDTRIIATGGSSNNKSILQVLADVFALPKCANSAVIGAAYRALNVSTNKKSFESPDLELACEPFKDTKEIYDPMLFRYKNNINKLIEKSNSRTDN